MVLGPLLMLGGAISETPRAGATVWGYLLIAAGTVGLVTLVLLALLYVPSGPKLQSNTTQQEGDQDVQSEGTEETDNGNSDFEQGERPSQDHPSISIVGPSTAGPGDTIVISVRNTGNVDIDAWGLTYPDGGIEEGRALSVGSQRSYSYSIPSRTTYPLAFLAEGITVRDDYCHDTLYINFA